MPFNLSSWFMRRRVDAHLTLSGRPVQPHRVVNPYHAVAISPGPGSCQAAAELKGLRHLAKSAPMLPLAGCQADSCRCRYVHYEDRRSGEDRRERAHAPRGNGLRERRMGEGRRETD